MPTVSVLIPVYNAEAYIANAVRSALAQRDVAVEVIVIDDGSTDATASVLQQFGDAIRVLRQKNAGHVCARRNGAQIASGKWLAFLDADDEWLPDKLARQLARADDTVGMVYTDRHNFGEIGRIHELASQAGPLWDGDLFEPLLFGNFVTVSSVIIRREWFDRLEGFETGLLGCEDWDMWLRFAAAGGRAAVVREPLTRYRWHGASMSFDEQRMCAGRLKVIRRAIASERARQLPRATIRRALGFTWRTSAWYAAPTKRWRALAWYLRSGFYCPWDWPLYTDIVKCCLARR